MKETSIIPCCNSIIRLLQISAPDPIEGTYDAPPDPLVDPDPFHSAPRRLNFQDAPSAPTL